MTGATREDVVETYRQFSGARFVKGRPYSPEQHIHSLSELQSFDRESIKKEAREFHRNIRKYVFDGAENFLTSLPKKDMYLLTYGEKDYQTLKVDNSGLREYFFEVIVTQGDKIEEIERMAQRGNFSPDEKIVFADNRCGHFAGARERGIITIHLKRPTDKYSKVPCEECQYVVSSFGELAQVLKNL